MEEPRNICNSVIGKPLSNIGFEGPRQRLNDNFKENLKKIVFRS
jgi:hypothetical protein